MIKITDYFLTAQEVADRLKINRITIWRWIKEGKFDTQKIGGVVLIPKWQVEILGEKKGYSNGDKKRIPTH